MKKLILLFFAIMISNGIIAQDQDFNKVYLDSTYNVQKNADAPFFALINKASIDIDNFEYIIYNNTSKLKKQSGFSVVNDKIYDTGTITSFFENGNKYTEFTLKEGKIFGLKTVWYDNGNTKLILEYIKDKNARLPSYKIISFWDENNIQKVIEGNGDYETEEDNVFEKGSLIDGFKDGNWSGHSKKSRLDFIEEYKNGVLDKGESVDENNNKRSYTEVFERPVPRKGYDHFYKYISKNFKFNKKTRGKSGKVLLTFVVEKDGSVSEIKSIKEVDQGLLDEGIRLIKSYPEWKPGAYRGKIVRVSFSIPITIKSEED